MFWLCKQFLQILLVQQREFIVNEFLEILFWIVKEIVKKSVNFDTFYNDSLREEWFWPYENVELTKELCILNWELGELL